MKVLVTGAAGQLGSDVCERLDVLGYTPVGVDKDDCDITDINSVLAVFDRIKPDAVIHCAAFTAVDKAESEPEECALVNETGSRNIALAAAKAGAKMVYISTDYVFPGTGETPFETTDATGPLNVYGKTKLNGEIAVRELCEKHFIVRTSWVFGVNGRNFVRSMLWLADHKDEVGVVCDQTGSPTYTRDLAKLLCDMIATEKYGTYHATNEGFCDWAEFADAIMKRAGKDCTANRITTAEYGAAADRPHNSRLSKKSLDEAGFERLPSWQDALDRYLSEC